ncbi:NAD(P)-binding domain-containing protein [Marinobacterium sedimentorum]|uniref:NAD(P)-binding domain-containing protein n=1 Tax=Marinobacterium sedimentorum TaxID=2927804 RepID=UPI0020C70D08|nr:NAD(P)-binding domain-containing protein [Marinobacterium sedimentorum]MCP8687205.1 NAD(P)-binding domain-containing protein [Marinobacterium sedimentorum]
MSPTLGIIGAGHLASYTVAGLRNGGDNRRILVSPRNREVAARLGRDYDCEIMATNQSVIDTADWILLAVRPEFLDSVLTECCFRDDQLVISCIAGVAAGRFAGLPIRLVRAMPLSCAEFGAGAVAIHPPSAEVEGLFGCLGSVIPLDNEEQFELATVAACYNGWLLDLFATVSEWLEQQGMAPDKARALTLSASSGAAALGTGRIEQSLRELSEGIATPNTLTRLGLDHLNDRGAFQPWAEACKLLSQQLDTRDRD